MNESFAAHPESNEFAEHIDAVAEAFASIPVEGELEEEVGA